MSELVGQPVLNVFYEPDRHAVQSQAAACFEQRGRMMRWEARIYWSDEMFRIFGLDPQVGSSSETFWQLVHPEDRNRVECPA